MLFGMPVIQIIAQPRRTANVHGFLIGEITLGGKEIIHKSILAFFLYFVSYTFMSL